MTLSTELRDAAIRLSADTSPVMRRAILRLIRKFPDITASRKPCDLDWRINEKAAWRAKIDAATENGKVGIVVAGMDCDCSKYYHEKVVVAPVSIVRWLRDYDAHCEWLDGPENMYFVKPSQIRDGYSEHRDLALEAYEDGHPHVVYL